MSNAVKINRVDTAAAFTTANLVLESGEQAWEVDTQKLKIGDGLTDWINLPYQFISSSVDNMVIVKQASDLVNIDSTKIYLIDGKIDLGTQSIEVPDTGFFYQGLDYFVSSLYSTEDNYTMFVNKTGEYSGNVRCTNVEHYVNGVNSQVFNLDNQGNFGAAEFISANFGNFSVNTTSLGTLKGYRQFRTNDAAFIKIVDGLILDDTWAGGMSVEETILLSIPAGCTIFKKGASLLFEGSVTSNINALSVDTTTTIFDFQESDFDLDWGFNLEGARFKNLTTPIPNIPASSTKRYFKNCRGVKNTFVGGGWKMTGEAVTALTEDVAAKIAGVTTYSNMVHFLGDVDNELKYNSEIETDFIFSGGLVIDGGPNDALQLTVRKYNNLTASYEDIASFERSVSNIIGGLDVAVINFATPIELAKDDRVELWLTNLSDNSDATVLNGSYTLLEER